jgi:hypothetical protein
MGQYFVVANLDKKEFINPNNFDEGIKFAEFYSGSYGTMSGLAILLSNSISKVDPWGRWAGDRIVIAGDYAEQNDPGEGNAVQGVYTRCHTGDFTNISQLVVDALAKDRYAVMSRPHFFKKPLGTEIKY